MKKRLREFASAIAMLDDSIPFEPVFAHSRAEAPNTGGQPWSEGLAASHPGQFAVARLQLDCRDIVVVSLYGIWDHTPEIAPKYRGLTYAEATLHRAISDLSPLFEERGDSEVVLTGDLNVWRNTNDRWQTRFDTVFDRLAALGLRLVGPLRDPASAPLRDCRCGQGDQCDHVETYRKLGHPNAKPYCDDFVFATKGLAVLSCAPVLDPVIREQKMSDHWPVLARFSLAQAAHPLPDPRRSRTMSLGCLDSSRPLRDAVPDS